ncbi:MAG: hypothetical protein ACJ8IK_19325 [Burkholderiaceae bacterium]
MLSILPALLSAATAAPGPAASAVAPTTSDTPDFGPNVHVFDPATPVATIQAALDDAFEAQRLSPAAQFGPQRHAFLFKPGRYDVVARVGYYTALQGLGLGPDDVRITGNVLADSGWNLHDKGNALINFWRSVENLAIAPAGGSATWAVSQAAPMRRVHVLGQLRVSPSNDGQPGQGYSSGGYLADSRIDGAVATGGQQQWYTRDSAVGGWSGKGWNTVFSGVRGAPATSFPQPPVTTLATTPRSREKPWLYLDATGKYRVFLPALRRDATGPSWSARHASPGRSIPLHRFFVARPGDTAATLNAALAQGLDLLFTPGVYPLAQTLRVTRAGTVVLGLGFPTLQPVDGITPMTVADVDGVRLAGLLFDAGSTNSDVLLAIGTRGSAVRHDADPISVQDVFFRIGGAVAGRATTSLVVDANDTLVDHVWAWRADHGDVKPGWTINPADTGVVVDGARVLATGLFVEHFRQYQVVWNGEDGRTIFFQNEMPYDVPDQAGWTSGHGEGWAAYKVGADVRRHEAWGLGSYCYFAIDHRNTHVVAAHAFEAPETPGVRLHSLVTVSLGGNGTIRHIVDDAGPSTETTGAAAMTLRTWP